MSKDAGFLGRRLYTAFLFLLTLKLGALGFAAFTEEDVMAPSPALAQGTAATSPDEISKATPQPSRIEPGGLDLEIIQDVKKRQNELDAREKELNRREERLKTMQTDLDRQISELKAVQAKIEEQIVLRNDLEKQAVTKLAKTYASMPPENAAELIQQIDTSIAIRVLQSMKERAAGRILAAVPPAVASKLSEGLVKKR